MFRVGLREGAKVIGLEAGATMLCLCVCETQKMYTNLEVRTKAVF